MFYVGMDDSISHNWQVAPNGVWHGKRPLRGRAEQIAVSNRRNGRLIAFYVWRRQKSGVSATTCLVANGNCNPVGKEPASLSRTVSQAGSA
jgi:hypothetical protein